MPWMHPFIASWKIGLSDRRGETRAHGSDFDHNSVSEYSRPAGVRRTPSDAIAAPTGRGLTGMNCAHGCITEWHCPRARKRGTVAPVSFPGFFHGQPVGDRKTQHLPPPA